MEFLINSSYVYGATLFLFSAKIKTPTLNVAIPSDDEGDRLDFVFANRVTIDMNNNRFVLAYSSFMYAYIISDDQKDVFRSTFYLCII